MAEALYTMWSGCLCRVPWTGGCTEIPSLGKLITGGTQAFQQQVFLVHHLGFRALTLSSLLLILVFCLFFFTLVVLRFELRTLHLPGIT
jgi:hypothetical protein